MFKTKSIIIFLIIFFVVLFFAKISLATVYDEIRQEATSPNNETNHPLPLISSWSKGNHWYYLNSGQYVPSADAAGFHADWVMQMIGQGHHMIAWMESPFPGQEINGPSNCLSCWNAYYQNAVTEAATHNLPLDFVGTQWEDFLSYDPAYYNLPPAQNPNVISLDGVVHTELDPWGRTYAKISPFGPTAPWYEVGKKWGSSAMMQQLENLYPNPPLIIFTSNNETNALRWVDVETDKRYVDMYGTGRDDNFKRQVVAEGWITRYSELMRGFRDGLSNSNWKSNSIFVGYRAFGPEYLGRWWGWKEYSLYIPNRIDPNPLMWDGGSPQFYFADYGIHYDYKAMCPQMEAMNWVFMQNEALQLNPEFWFEVSFWAGTDSVKNIFAAEGQNWTPERYAGSVQFSMWLNRPRIVRDYPYSNGAGLRSVDQPWMDPLIAAVDRIYNNSVLKTFWRQGQLVTNTTRQHPYQIDIPPEYASVNRMFMLTTNLDPAQPWSLDTVIPVFSMARVIGTSPNRQWLVYAFSPQANRTGVQITIPNFRSITINTTVPGSFYLVDEASGTISDPLITVMPDTTPPSAPTGVTVS